MSFRPFRPLIALVVLTLAACGEGSGGTPTGTSQTNNQSVVTFAGGTLNISFATTCAQREQGLKGVLNLEPNGGMLFAFADDRQRFFWMKDTPTPLSIAFLDQNKKVVFLADMAANSTTQVGGFNAPLMRYAVEANTGWFASHGVTLGATASFTVPSTLSVEPDCLAR